MSTNKWTPGPWSVGGKYANKSVLLNANGQSIASGGNNRVIQGEVLEASLTLAAAAPELYEACEAAWNCLLDLPVTQARVETAQMLGAAIVKARGES